MLASLIGVWERLTDYASFNATHWLRPPLLRARMSTHRWLPTALAVPTTPRAATAPRHGHVDCECDALDARTGATAQLAVPAAQHQQQPRLWEQSVHSFSTAQTVE